MAAGPAADIGPSGQVGFCGEYVAIFDFNWVQERAVKLVDGGAVGNNGNVISSTTPGSIQGVAGGARHHWCPSSTARCTPVSNSGKRRLSRVCCCGRV